MYTEKKIVGKIEEKRIVITINIIIFIVFFFLFFSFWELQVLRNNYYSDLSSKNIIREIELEAPRGFIKDVKGRIIAENRLNFDLLLLRNKIQDTKESLKRLSLLTGFTKERLKKIIDKYAAYPLSFPVPVKRGITFRKAIFLGSRSDEYPELKINADPARKYPYGESASHVIGYVSEISDKELKTSIFSGYNQGEMVGKSGIEYKYENYLKGKCGEKTVIRDNLGRIRKVLSVKDPVIGKTVILSLDIDLERYIESLYGDYNGAAGVVDLRNGEMIAMVSMPNFSPEFFTSNFSTKDWRDLIGNKDKPLHNRFIRGLYSPGSTFKIVMALAGLSDKKIYSGTGVVCTGSAKFYGRVFHCWNRSGHGWMNLEDALKNSCNIYFYTLGRRMDIDVISKFARYLGFGEKSGLDVPGEMRGILPSREWTRRVFNRDWYPGETISVAIGGGMISATPIQLLRLISVVALRGSYYKFHFMREIIGHDGVVEKYTPVKTEIPIKKEYFNKVINGLYRCVNDGGTGRAAKVDGVDVCGKTGTQLILSLENPRYKVLAKQRRFTPHSWFVSFAPRENPRYAIVVFVENGGDAGRIAAPIAGKIYRRLFKYE